MKVPDIGQIEAGGLAGFLRSVFFLSLFCTIVSPYGDTMSQISDDQTERYGRPDGFAREQIYMRKFARAVNPHGIAPVLMVLSAGFLVILRGLRASTELLLAALQPARTYRSGYAPPLPVPKPAPAPLVRPIGRAMVDLDGVSLNDDDRPATLRPKR